MIDPNSIRLIEVKKGRTKLTDKFPAIRTAKAIMTSDRNSRASLARDGVKFKAYRDSVSNATIWIYGDPNGGGDWEKVTDSIWIKK